MTEMNEEVLSDVEGQDELHEGGEEDKKVR